MTIQVVEGVATDGDHVGHADGVRRAETQTQLAESRDDACGGDPRCVFSEDVGGDVRCRTRRGDEALRGAASSRGEGDEARRGDGNCQP